jgi:LysR family nitrogen assimilation transcriptional regulator
VLSRNAVANSLKPSAYRMRSIEPALRSRLSLAISSVRPATLTQQTTLDLIRHTLTSAATPA